MIATMRPMGGRAARPDSRKDGPPATPEERQIRIQASLERAEQRRIDADRARADYNAENDALNANMTRLRALRLAKEADEKKAGDARAETDAATRAARERPPGKMTRRAPAPRKT